MTENNHRTIRSFVKREGRMTAAQRHAMDALMPVYGILDLDHAIEPDSLFTRAAPCYLEIGFGMGASLVEMAECHPDRNFIGIEVHRPGVGATLLGIDALQLQNLKLINHDAVTVLKQIVPANSMDGVYLFFPDPWPKKRHHKRRILQNDFVRLVHRCLKTGGIFHMATDWQDYADAMIEVMQTTEGFSNAAGSAVYSARGDRPETKYERRGRRLGHEVRDLVYIKTG